MNTSDINVMERGVRMSVDCSDILTGFDVALIYFIKQTVNLRFFSVSFGEEEVRSGEFFGHF